MFSEKDSTPLQSDYFRFLKFHDETKVSSDIPGPRCQR